jgi:hypothetical protein
LYGLFLQRCRDPPSFNPIETNSCTPYGQRPSAENSFLLKEQNPALLLVNTVRPPALPIACRFRAESKRAVQETFTHCRDLSLHCCTPQKGPTTRKKINVAF